MYKHVEFTRDGIYKLVWERPVLAIAREIGVSDVALSKACRRAGVPLPGRGYWAAVKSGRALKVAPLPAPMSGQPTVVQFDVLENPPAPVPKVPATSAAQIEVPVQLAKPHRLVAELQAAAKSAREDKGVLALNYEKVLRVRTSAQHMRRALILMDTLIKQFALRGYTVRIGDKYKETELVLSQGEVSFRLDERTTRTEPPPLPPRPARRGHHEPDYEPWRPAYVMAGTGEFTLEFGKYGLEGCRRVWKDKSGSPLEAQLHEVMEALPSWEALLEVKRLEREEQEAIQREAEERRVAAARAGEIVRRQRVDLVKNLHAWERAERLRRFVRAFEETAGPSPEALIWLEWAKAQIHALDPLSDMAAVTSLEVQLDKNFTGYSSWNKPEECDWWS